MLGCRTAHPIILCENAHAQNNFDKMNLNTIFFKKYIVYHHWLADLLSFYMIGCCAAFRNNMSFRRRSPSSSGCVRMCMHETRLITEYCSFITKYMKSKSTNKYEKLVPCLWPTNWLSAELVGAQVNLAQRNKCPCEHLFERRHSNENFRAHVCDFFLSLFTWKMRRV